MRTKQRQNKLFLELPCLYNCQEFAVKVDQSIEKCFEQFLFSSL